MLTIMLMMVLVMVMAKMLMRMLLMLMTVMMSALWLMHRNSCVQHMNTLCCSTCNVQMSTSFYGMCSQCFDAAIERARRSTRRVKLYRLYAGEYMPGGVIDIQARVTVGTVLEMLDWPGARPIGLVVNGFQLDPSLPIGLFPSKDPIYVVFDNSSLLWATAATAAADEFVVNDSLSLPNAEIVTRPCADLRDVHTPPTPSPR